MANRRVVVEAGTAISPRAKQRPSIGSFTAPANTSAIKAVRVSSSTSRSRQADSDTVSNDAHTEYGDLDPGLSGADRHFLSMLESSDISVVEADQAFNDYFF